MTQEQIIEHVIKYPVVPVFYNSDPEVCKSIFDACYKGGIRVFEFTNRGANALATFKELAALLKNYPGYALGAGTILNDKDAEAFIEAGASFIVSPCYSEDVFDVCYHSKVPYMPGCMTVKEIFDASNAGCEVVKIFPGEVVGHKFVKSVKTVLPNQKMMVTGGVEPTKESFDTWFGAGVTAVGMGSQLFKKEWLDNKNYQAVTDVCKKCFEILG
ncbi:bifunctional 4-hydroxy-2-oxoglutarate aldolase/2-dehydro-3-deoxy-phosphogluconate aldolase [Chitinophagaceae bacterium LWZ2-11]